MNNKPAQKFLKLLFGIALGGMLLVLWLGIGSSPSARAQEGWTETPTATPVLTETPVPTETSTPAAADYYSVEPLSLSDGIVVEEMIIHGPPVPPPGYEIQRQSVSVPDILNAAGTNILTVPAYPWVFGCSAVSGAMIAGYYDRNGYPNMYTGPTDGGVMPLVNNSSWGSWDDVPPTFTYYNNPLVASKLGLDGRVIRGSIDDYWVQNQSSAPDPFIGHWTEHTWGDAIGDYMHTSQSSYNGSSTWGLADAYTRFYDVYPASGAKLTCDTIASYLPYGYPPDGTLGRAQFYQAKGYAITDCYNQHTDNQYSGGFSFAQYKAEIDAGRPVMINLTGHTIVGVGYADPNTVYIHDTWDNQTHSMTWGGSYSGMTMVAVSIVNLAPANYSVLNVAKTGNGSSTVTSNPAGINCGSTCTYSYANNTIVILTATASTGSTFTGWSGGGCSGIGTCTVTLTSDTYITANFRSHTLDDFNGNGTTDVSIFRKSTGTWYIKDQFFTNYGLVGDIPVPGDYNGDGRTDVAVYRPSAGTWYVKDQFFANYGIPGDIPVQGDYNGDGTTDVAVYRPSAGTWYVKDQFFTSYGLPGDIPVPGDYNGDGITDIAVYRPSAGTWYIKDQFYTNYGLPGDIPIPGDYNGDGRTDVAVYRPSAGTWYIKDQFFTNYGLAGDIAIPGDYNGNGTTDIAVYRPSVGTWYVKDQFFTNYGIPGDIPLPEMNTGKATTAP